MGFPGPLTVAGSGSLSKADAVGSHVEDGCVHPDEDVTHDPQRARRDINAEEPADALRLACLCNLKNIPMTGKRAQGRNREGEGSSGKGEGEGSK